MVIEMEKKKWLWNRKSSERSPGESESSESFSSHSERYSDEQDLSRESLNDSPQSPEASSRAKIRGDEVKESVNNLTEKLSAALVNVSAKEDLVKQHAKVAEEAVAGWEKAENEVTSLKQQLEVAVQQNLNLEVRVSHLDGALKECVRQLRQARDEQEKLSDAMVDKNIELESIKSELEKQIHELQAQAEAVRTGNAAFVDPKTQLSLEVLEKENSSLKLELVFLLKEIEIITVERDLITQAAETASKLQLESIKKVSKLEAECRRLQAVARKSSPGSNQKSFTASSFCTESLTDSHSDSGERMNLVDSKTSNMETNVFELSCSDSWASALIAELDQFKKERPMPKSLAACSIEIDMMDDFLEMERLAALPETKSNTLSSAFESASTESISMHNPLKPELDSMIERIADLEKMLEKIEAEKLELEIALDKSLDSLKAGQSRMADAEIRLEDMQKELAAVHEAKELLEFQLDGMEVEARTMSANVDSLKAEVGKEQTLSAELIVKYRELESELSRNIQETEFQQNTNSNGKQNLKQEDLAVAANKLAECQKTIASLGRQLQSLATLEDFLIDTSNIPGFSSGPSFSDIDRETWKLSSNDMFIPKCDSDLDSGSLNDYEKLFSPS